MKKMFGMLVVVWVFAFAILQGTVQAEDTLGLDALVLAGDCNGGSAVAPTTPPLVIHCPTQGGPKCKDTQRCRCTAVKNATSGVWESENTCS